MLDIGTGSGRDLAELLALGYEAFGTEPVAQMAAAAIAHHPELAGRTSLTSMYAIEFTRTATKALAFMPAAIRTLLVARLEQLSADPFRMAGVRKLVGVRGYRLRVGDWRVIDDIESDRLIVRVLKIGTRGKVYT